MMNFLIYYFDKMTSVERIVEYTKLDKEPIDKGILKPPKNWPNKGIIEFKNVSLSYDRHMPNVLKNITLKINKQEKIGIIGRTGAGKSSFFQTLFRMYEANGSIFIDNIDIKKLSLNDLRSRITIIPVS
jgi:ABC-type multidrug transport system fused ATPase/permease subunit